MEWVRGNPNDRSVTGFRIRHGGARGPMSVKLYNKLKARGEGPRETVLGDGIIVVSVADEAAFDEARANPTGDEAERVAELRARWHRRALAAGKAAAESPIHVSKQKKGRAKRPARSK